MARSSRENTLLTMIRRRVFGVPIQEVVWSAAFINDLPDSAFLLILPGGSRDAGGKTVPRSLRKFPYKDKSGKVDLPHIRNAIARIPQATGISAEQKARLQARARGILERAQT